MVLKVRSRSTYKKTLPARPRLPIGCLLPMALSTQFCASTCLPLRFSTAHGRGPCCSRHLPIPPEIDVFRPTATRIFTQFFLGAGFLLPAVGLQTRLPASRQASPSKPANTRHATASAVQLAPWTGDFGAMLKRRFIRVFVASSKTQYYVANGVQHGSS
jgi:hypothetical protein